MRTPERLTLTLVLITLLLGGCDEQSPEPPPPAQQQQPAHPQMPVPESLPAAPPPAEKKFEAPTRQKAKPAEALEREATPDAGGKHQQGGGDSDDMDRVD